VVCNNEHESGYLAVYSYLTAFRQTIYIAKNRKINEKKQSPGSPKKRKILTKQDGFQPFDAINADR
jgi:hypothetical protein